MILAASWTDEQVENLNRYQASGIFHEFKCSGDHPGSRVLIATRDGWFCPGCSFKQGWAHEFMLNFSRDQFTEACVLVPGLKDARPDQDTTGDLFGASDPEMPSPMGPQVRGEDAEAGIDAGDRRRNRKARRRLERRRRRSQRVSS